VLLPRTQWSEFGEEFQMSQRDGKQKSASDVISMPNVTLDLMMPIIQKLGQENNKPEWAHFEVPNIVYETVEATCKYSNYLSRQAEEMVRWRKYNFVSIPADITYNHDTFPSFSSEELEKLSKYKPTTLHEASQLQGVTPHSLVYLQNYLAKSRRSRNKVYTGGTRDNLIQSRENIDYIDGDHE
jgi:tRNA uridine 5-carboxymethylaminomethyl modification enzyme